MADILALNGFCHILVKMSGYKCQMLESTNGTKKKKRKPNWDIFPKVRFVTFSNYATTHCVPTIGIHQCVLTRHPLTVSQPGIHSLCPNNASITVSQPRIHHLCPNQASSVPTRHPSLCPNQASTHYVLTRHPLTGSQTGIHREE